ncbi:MAG: hypothetical protein JSS11_00275 [Verrucomicrobia bacterium]|nr:hypothetical protein [Verrucomicrobiota bacterium]
MPNQLAKTKSRQSVAEHRAVLAALEAIARREQKPVVALMREALRALIRERATNPAEQARLRPVVWSLAPRPPDRLRTAAQVRRFKREQRDFDRVLMDLQLAAPSEIQARNSLVRSDQPVRMIDFARAHAKA